ncbi:hypothetical protein [Bacillus sp. FJAT-42315]|uniref:hypothetical protein n=1 Tax=Bacillus sp. FJAT-42315 TaxID=2014077 RepID=UPI0012FEDEF0|nr:hypothetical protein [Bacillus sp. FJAT-42315]
MDKAMHGAHGVGYEVYSQNHEVRMDVERQREEDYINSRRMVADFSRRFINHLS